MKKFIWIIALFTGCCFISCDKDVSEIEISPNKGNLEVRATIGEQESSRISLSELSNGNIKTDWKENDAFLGVADGTVVEFTEGKPDGAIAKFTPDKIVEEGTKVNAFYPLLEDIKNDAASTDGFNIDLNNQDGTLNSLTNYAYMTTQSTVVNGTLNFKFRHEIAIFRLTDNGGTITKGVSKRRVYGGLTVRPVYVE